MCVCVCVCVFQLIIRQKVQLDSCLNNSNKLQRDSRGVCGRNARRQIKLRAKQLKSPYVKKDCYFFVWSKSQFNVRPTYINRNIEGDEECRRKNVDEDQSFNYYICAVFKL